MRLFLRVVKLAVLQQTTYRTALIAGLVTNFIFGLFRAAVVVALYNGRPEVNGMSLELAITYIAVGQALIAFLFIFGSYDQMATVYSGSVGSDLIRPMGLFRLWLARDLGKALVNLVVRGVLLLLFFSLFYHVITPSNPAGWFSTSLSLALSWLVCYAWRFLVNLSSFWTPDARGIARAAYTASQFFSGFILPLRLYPDWFANFCQLTPFPAMFNSGVEVYLGLAQGADLWRTLIIQAGWFLVLGLACHLVLRAGLRRLVIQGG
jgi:ABC-2 type transport system permease protein